LNKNDYLKLVREIQADSFNVHKSQHAIERMIERDVSDQELFLCLRDGQIEEDPKQNENFEWESVLNCFSAGRNISVPTIITEHGNKKIIFIKTVICS